MAKNELREALLALRSADEVARHRLATDGSLFEGYQPELAAVHRRNAERLAILLDRHGWPGRSLAGEDGAEAAWLVAQHAIGWPAFMRRCLELLDAAVAAGEAPAWQLAYLVDRVRTLEGRPQLYGTQFDWDADGELSPLPIEEPQGVEQRRRRVGLGSFAARWREAREQTASEAEHRPRDPLARQREMDSWARSVGWRA